MIGGRQIIRHLSVSITSFCPPPSPLSPLFSSLLHLKTGSHGHYVDFPHFDTVWDWGFGRQGGRQVGRNRAWQLGWENKTDRQCGVNQFQGLTTCLLKNQTGISLYPPHLSSYLLSPHLIRTKQQHCIEAEYLAEGTVVGWMD